MTATLDRSDASGPGASAAAGLARSRAVWAVVITGLALFMASLDNLVVSTALPVIRVHLHAGLSGLEWTVNAYTLTFAVLLLTAAAMGERFGRRRIFVLGIAVFTAGLGGCRPGAEHRGAGGGPGRPGGRRGHDHAPLAHPAQRGGPARATQRRPRHLGGHRRDGRGHRPAGGWGRDHRLGLAVHLLAQRARRAGPGPAGLVEAVRVPGRAVPARPGRGASWSASGCSAWSSAWSGATPTAGRAPGCSPRSSSASPALAAFVCLGAAGRITRCWTCACSATGASPPST